MYLDDELWLAEGWSYNSNEKRLWTASHSTYFVSRSGTVYAQCAFGIYNGDDYDIYYTNKTPRLDVGSIRAITARTSPAYGMNSKGQTYGPGCYEFVPDLIKAIGVGGVKGYVLNAELLSTGMKTSPNDVILNVPATIPLYAEDGTTVIGQFAFSNPQ